jgi:phosphoribosylanthranilate isomerase
MLPAEPATFDSLQTQGPVIKICGLTQPEHAVFAATRGADMVGQVFAPSRRQVSPDLARQISSAVHMAATPALLAGVFVNEQPGRIREIVDFVGLDVIQLSGDEPDSTIIECARYRPVLKAVRFPPGASFDDALARVRRYTSLGLQGRLRVLVDAYHLTAYGGTGQAADWLLASRLAAHEPIMLAGGLHPGNAAGAVRTVNPWGVDVSSGVERDGAKHPDLIADFIDAVRSVQLLSPMYGPYREEPNPIW